MKVSRKYRKQLKKKIVTALSSLAVVLFCALAVFSLIGDSVSIDKLSRLKSNTSIQAPVEGELENTDTNTYIYNANDMVAFRDSVNAGNDYAGKTVYLMNDIDMSTVCSETLGSFTPIGATGTYFAGTFNGKYHKISNLYMKDSNYVLLALFYRTDNKAVIRNLIMENVSIYNNHNVLSEITYASGITAMNYGKIVNCGIESGSITAIKTDPYTESAWVGSSAGGIAGDNIGIINSCYNKATITGKVLYK